MSPAGKYSFGLLSFLLLAFFVTASWNAPVSGDEYVHFKQAEKNIRYFRTLGKDKSALDTPISRLKYYGQSFDNLTTWLIETFHIINIMRFRHVSNALAGWLLLIFSGLLAARISGDVRVGMLTILLLAISPRFTGHVLNNLKDIPFALGYTASVYFIFRLLEDFKRPYPWIIAGLILSMAFTISIRIGGVLVICYLWLFWILRVYQNSLSGSIFSEKKYLIKSGIALIIITITSWFLGMIFWPWAWEEPILHPVEAFMQIHHYPTTLRQLFEGKLYWSELFPWYYLPKYILITVPLAVLTGLAIYIFRFKKFLKADRFIFHIFLAITMGFPIVYTVMTGANVYGGWRQLLFAYPPMVIMAAMGIFSMFERRRKVFWQRVLATVLVLFAYFPVKYMVGNYPYYYIYFNPLVGGVAKAYGNYELDYYFTGYKRAYEWIDQQVVDEPQPIKVATNFMIPWYYEHNLAGIQPVYFDYYMRGNYKWDYAVVPGTFLSPYQLKEHIWPPKNTVYKVEVRGVPVCVVIKRMQYGDLKGFEAMQKGRYEESIRYFLEAIKSEPRNETVLLNLARVYYYQKKYANSEYFLNKLLAIYPGNEWAFDLLGEIHYEEGDLEGAVRIWKKNLDYNYKFYHSYINLSKVYMKKGMDEEARSVLFTCLRINPFYKPVLKAIGNWYNERGLKDKARKYLDKASKIKE